MYNLLEVESNCWVCALPIRMVKPKRIEGICVLVVAQGSFKFSSHFHFNLLPAPLKNVSIVHYCDPQKGLNNKQALLKKLEGITIYSSTGFSNLAD